MSSILRRSQVLQILSIGRTTLDDRFIATGRLRPVKIGGRATGFFADEVNALVEDLRRERDQLAHTAKKATP